MRSATPTARTSRHVAELPRHAGAAPTRQAGSGEGVGVPVQLLLWYPREPLRRLVGLRLDPALAGRVDASDIVQDVMLEVSQRLADYLRDPAMPFHLWLRHIARDHMIDAHRRHRQPLRPRPAREQPI